MTSRRLAIGVLPVLLVAAAFAAFPVGAGAEDGRGAAHEHGTAAVAVGAPEHAGHGSNGGTHDLAHRSSSAIQDRIDAASAGAVIVIEEGMYHGDLVVDRAVTLEASGHVLVRGDGSGSVILVTGRGATIRGLHVQRSGIGPVEGPAGVRIEADDVTVERVLVDDAYMGIAVFGGRRVRLLDNTVHGRELAAIDDEGHATSSAMAREGTGATGGHGRDAMSSGAVPTLAGRPLRGDGITLWNVRGALVRGNLVEHVRDGIFISFGRNLLIDGNRIIDSRYALHEMFALDLFVAENTFDANLSGAVLMYGGPVLLLRNRIQGSSSDSTGFGVLLKDVAGADAVENVIVDNRVGIQVDGAGDDEHAILVHGNTLALNRYGVSLYPSAGATFYRNSFVENVVQVVAQGHGVAGKNSWVHEGMGNYWSDYRGYDLGGEGLGDVAHHEGGSMDRLIVRAPVLQALASGPALSLLGAVEDRWIEHESLVVDPLPLMRPHSPTLDDGGQTSDASAAFASAGLLGLALAGGALVALRRPLRLGRVGHAG